jgi:hypothetical protein
MLGGTYIMLKTETFAWRPGPEANADHQFYSGARWNYFRVAGKNRMVLVQINKQHEVIW